jgi:hypothetical protein
LPSRAERAVSAEKKLAEYRERAGCQQGKYDPRPTDARSHVPPFACDPFVVDNAQKADCPNAIAGAGGFGSVDANRLRPKGHQRIGASALSTWGLSRMR